MLLRLAEGMAAVARREPRPWPLFSWTPLVEPQDGMESLAVARQEGKALFTKVSSHVVWAALSSCQEIATGELSAGHEALRPACRQSRKRPRWQVAHHLLEGKLWRAAEAFQVLGAWFLSFRRLQETTPRKETRTLKVPQNLRLEDRDKKAAAKLPRLRQKLLTQVQVKAMSADILQCVSYLHVLRQEAGLPKAGAIMTVPILCSAKGPASLMYGARMSF